MAHVGQEYGLGLVGGFSLILKTCQSFREFMFFGLIIDPYRGTLIGILIVKRHQRYHVMPVRDDHLLPVFTLKLLCHILLGRIVIQLGKYLPCLFVYKQHPVHGIYHHETFFYRLYDIVPGHYHGIEHAETEY